MLFDAAEKAPAEVLDYTFGWKSYIGDDTIATWSIAEFPSEGLVLDRSERIGDNVRIWVSAGSLGTDYQARCRVVTTAGRHLDWVLKIRLVEYTEMPIHLEAPPYASVSQAIAMQPSAEGEEPYKVERVLDQASRFVADWARRPTWTYQTGQLRDDFLKNDHDIPVGRVDLYLNEGFLKIENEVVRYFGRSTPSTPDPTQLYQSTRYVGFPSLYGPGTLKSVRRGVFGSEIVSHNEGALIQDITYPLLARDAELAVFEWLWLSRGWKPGRSGVLGSESYSLDYNQIKQLVKANMPQFYTGGGRVKSASVVTQNPRTDRGRSWIGNV